MTFDFSCVNFLGMGGTFLILHTFQEQGETLKIKAHFMIMVHFFRDQGDFYSNLNLKIAADFFILGQAFFHDVGALFNFLTQVLFTQYQGDTFLIRKSKKKNHPLSPISPLP